MLTPLEAPSPDSSTGPREVERSLQATPQLPEPLPMAPPPESEKHCDAAESSRVAPVLKRWVPAKFKKTNKNQASQPPNQLSTESRLPDNHRSDSQSQPTPNMAGPSRYAATQRVRVSVVPLVDNRHVVCLTKHLSERSPKPLIGFVVQVCSLAPLFIPRRRVEEIQRLRTPTKLGEVLLVADQSPQVQRK